MSYNSAKSLQKEHAFKRLLGSLLGMKTCAFVELFIHQNHCSAQVAFTLFEPPHSFFFIAHILIIS